MCYQVPNGVFVYMISFFSSLSLFTQCHGGDLNSQGFMVLKKDFSTQGCGAGWTSSWCFWAESRAKSGQGGSDMALADLKRWQSV